MSLASLFDSNSVADEVCDRDASFYKVENQLTDDGILASDHRPVIADILL